MFEIETDSDFGGVPIDIYHRLASATPAERVELVIQLIEAHPEGRLELPVQNGVRAVLDGIDLSRLTPERLPDRGTRPWWSQTMGSFNLHNAVLDGASLRQANLQGVNLQHASLKGALLEGANLRSALLEAADLQEADLAGCDLYESALSEINLEDALLEEADLQHSTLRFANLRGAVLEWATLEGADLWGATLDGADLSGANLRRVVLREATLRRAEMDHVDLREAQLGLADLQEAKMVAANLRGAALKSTNLEGANLQDARLEGLVLYECHIAHIHLSGAWLDKTRFRQKQLGGAIGEELAERYEQAGLGYLTLERNFEELGDPDAASWAYRKKRRMQKMEALKRARTSDQWRLKIRYFAKFLSDRFVEWLCDYGESITRILRALLLIYLLFILIYIVTGSVARIVETPMGVEAVLTRNPVDVAIFSLIVMSSAEGPAVGLAPRNELVHILTGIQTLLSIALTGLLGFVLGNRIRR